MGKGVNSNKTNLLFVCCVVAAALLFVLNTMRTPDTGRETTANTVQVVDNAGSLDNPLADSDEAADSQSQDEGRGNSAAGSDEATDSQSATEARDNPSEGSAGVSEGQPEVGGDSIGSQPEETSEGIPESAEAILGDAQSAQWGDISQEQLYTFRNDRLLNQHYEKHGIEMGFATIEEYVAAANAVINHPDALHKQEAEDNDDVYFLEATNEFVVVSTDGYIRTYFIASGGIDYYNRQ